MLDKRLPTRTYILLNTKKLSVKNFSDKKSDIGGDTFGQQATEHSQPETPRTKWRKNTQSLVVRIVIKMK
jgi:hypothetical protein